MSEKEGENVRILSGIREGEEFTDSLIDFFIIPVADSWWLEAKSILMADSR